MYKKALMAIFCLVSIVAGAAQAGTGAGGDSALGKTLQGQLDHAYGPTWATKDPAKFVSEFLTDDAVVTASDGPTVWAGKTQSTKLITELMLAFPRIKAKAVWTAPVGHGAAYQYVVFELIPPATQKDAKTVTAKSLYVWVKTAKGWRVTADHFSYTGMDMPK